MEEIMVFARYGARLGLCRLLAVLALAMVVPACGKRKQGLTITGFSPTGGSVARYTIVYIDFDRALDPNTWPTSFTFQDGTGTGVAATISFNSTLNQIAIKPSGGTPLAGGTTFTVVILGTLMGADGSTFAGDAFQFTTEAATAGNGGQPGFGGLTSATAPAPPPPIGTIVLVWPTATDPDPNIVYDIYMSTVMNGEDLSQPPFLSTPNTTGITLSGLASNVTFYFIVRARESDTGNIDFNAQERSAKTN
jgi:hypothetical protein